LIKEVKGKLYKTALSILFATSLGLMYTSLFSEYRKPNWFNSKHCYHHHRLPCTNPPCTNPSNIHLQLETSLSLEETFGVGGVSEGILFTFGVNVRSGLLALEIDNLLIDFDDDDFYIGSDIVVESLMITMAQIGGDVHGSGNSCQNI
jgi:hypothetical protein